MVPDETHKRVKNDGRHIGYLSKPRRFQHIDHELFRQLGVIVRENRRSVGSLRESGWLPGAAHHDRRLDFNGTTANSPAGRARRATLRQAWVQEALDATASCRAVFLDPDNGIASDHVSPHEKKAPKYVFLEDVKAFLGRPQIVTVYHHADRDGDHETQARDLLQLANGLLEPGGYAGVVRFVPYSPRFFLILANPAQADDAQRRVATFMATSWSSVFEGPWEGSSGASSSR